MNDAQKLSLFNGALRECNERKLASLTENREPRRLLDDIWTDGQGMIRYVLQQGQWRFAARTVEITADTGLEPDFGYTNAFVQPDDFVRTRALCSDPHLRNPILDYNVEAGVWYADTTPIYVNYVSDGEAYGSDYTLWPPAFTLYVETHMASLIAGRLTGSKADRNDLLKLADMRLRKAKSFEAMEGPTEFPPMGSWARARLASGRPRQRDIRTGLIG